MASISVPIEMLVTRSSITSITTGTWNSAIQRFGLLDGRLDLFLLVHADRLAAQAFDHRLVVDAVAARSCGALMFSKPSCTQ